MKEVSLSGSKRSNVGKKDAAKLRKEGQVPAVLYGGSDQTHFSINAVEFQKYIYSPDVFKFNLDVDGNKVQAIIQEVQFHPVTDQILHVDFLELVDGKPVRIKLPVRLLGSALGVRNGGKASQNFRRLQVVGLPNALPEAIEVNIEQIRIGQSVRVKDIAYEGLTFLDPANAVVFGVKTARGAVDEEEEEEGEEAAAEGEEAPAAEAAAE